MQSSAGSTCTVFVSVTFWYKWISSPGCIWLKAVFHPTGSDVVPSVGLWIFTRLSGDMLIPVSPVFVSRVVLPFVSMTLGMFAACTEDDRKAAVLCRSFGVVAELRVPGSLPNCGFCAHPFCTGVSIMMLTNTASTCRIVFLRNKSLFIYI